MSHLRESGQLTAGLILRALLSGNIVLFEEALAELSRPAARDVSPATSMTGTVSGFRALYRKAGLPDAAYPAFREAVTAMREGVLLGEQGGAARLKRRIVEWVLDALRARMRKATLVPLLTAAAALRGRGGAR